MTEKEQALNRFQNTDNLVLFRLFNAEGGLEGVVPNTHAWGSGPRVAHGVADKDGKINPELAKKGLDALTQLGEGDGPASKLLNRLVQAGQTWSIQIVASPITGLLARLEKREGSLEDSEAFVDLLNRGDVRAAEKAAGVWAPQPYVIDAILNYFKTAPNQQIEPGYWDKIPLRNMGKTDKEFEAEGVRYAPGCKVRTGSYVGPGTVIMNQAFVNIGAYIAGGGVMIDGGSRVASAAQIGRNVKFGAGSGIEGILEPAGRLPSIVEDHVKIGAMCEVTGIVGEGAVVASGVIMASGKKIYDEAAGELVPPIKIPVGDKVFQVPVIPPYRLAVGGSLISENGKTATDVILIKKGDLRDRDTMRHFEKQGVLYQ